MATSEARTEIVCDAGPLIHLDEVGCLSLLGDFAIVRVPGEVWEEVSSHRPTAIRRSDVGLQRTSVGILKGARLLSLVQGLALGSGEQATLSLMSQHPEAIMLTDDAAARLAATTLGYRVHGTIGVLLRAIRRGQRTADEVLAILQTLPERSTLHIRPALLEGIIRQVRERAGGR